MYKSHRTDGFIVAIDKNSEIACLKMPDITEENGWLVEEEDYWREATYKLKPGVYTASYVVEYGTSHEGEVVCEGTFDHFEPVWLLEDQPS